MNIYQFFLESELSSYLLNTVENNAESEKNHGESTDRNLSAVLDMFHRSLHPVPKNGDCLLNAIAFSILGILNTTAQANVTLKGHFSSLGLNASLLTMEQMGVRLRQMMVSEMISSEEKYSGFLKDIQDQKRTFEETVNYYGNPGVFAGDVVKAVSNALKVPVVLLTSMKNYPVITISPDVFFKNAKVIVYLLRSAEKGLDTTMLLS